MNKSNLRYLAASFIISFLIRVTPELIAYPIPIGFDVVNYYAPAITYFPLEYKSLFATPMFSPMIYLIIKPVTMILDIFNSIRLISCILYGLLAMSTYIFSCKRLKWSPQRSAMAAIFVASQFVTLRIGWDLLKNELGLILLILILSIFPSTRKRDTIILSLTSIILSLTHHLSYLLLLILLSVTLIQRYKARDKRGDVLIPFIPSVFVFFISYAASRYLPPQFPSEEGVRVSFVFLGYKLSSIPQFIDYLSTYNWSYGALSLEVISLFVFLYLIYLPLVLLGYFREQVSTTWAIIVLLISFQVLVTPSYGFWFWDRWMLLLFFPLFLYAFSGIHKITNKIRLKPTRVLAVMLLLSPYIALSTGFITHPPETPFPYFRNPMIWPHFPSSLQSNTLSLTDTEDTKIVLKNLNSLMNESTVLLVHEAFYGWASLNIRKNTTIINYHHGTPSDVIPLAHQKGLKTIFTIWWIRGYEWYGQTITEDFIVFMRRGRIAVYLYTGNSTFGAEMDDLKSYRLPSTSHSGTLNNIESFTTNLIIGNNPRSLNMIAESKSFHKFC